MIVLLINGEKFETSATRLDELMLQNKVGSQNFAVAVNQRFIAKINYPNTALKSGDQIELVVPMQGG